VPDLRVADGDRPGGRLLPGSNPFAYLLVEAGGLPSGLLVPRPGGFRESVPERL